jgi:phosphatidylglycerophosphate synthase
MMLSGVIFYTLSPSVHFALPAWLTFTILVRDFFIVLFVYLLYTRVQVTRFPPSWAGKMSTLLQATTLGCVIAVNGPWPQLHWLGEILFRAALAVTLFSSWDYLRRAQGMLEKSLARA